MASDFTSIIEGGLEFTQFEEDVDVDFFPIGDSGVVVIEGAAYGEGAYGEGIYGGSSEVVIIDALTTIWTNIGTP